MGMVLIFTLIVWQSPGTCDKFTHGANKKLLLVDIDDTLTNINPVTSTEVLKFAVTNGYDLGVITASNRPPQMLCDGARGNKSQSPYMPDFLCEYLHRTDYKTYNNYTMTMGQPHDIDRTHPYLDVNNRYKYGWRKGVQASIVRDALNFDEVVILDDQRVVCDGINHSTNDQITAFIVDNKIPDQSVDIHHNHALRKRLSE